MIVGVNALQQFVVWLAATSDIQSSCCYRVFFSMFYDLLLNLLWTRNQSRSTSDKSGQAEKVRQSESRRVPEGIAETRLRKTAARWMTLTLELVVAQHMLKMWLV